MTGRAHVLLGLVLGCGGPEVGDERDAAVIVEPPDAALLDPSVPEGTQAIDAWIDSGQWLGWACQPTPRTPTPPSAHERSRICQNSIVTAAVGGEGNWPVGAAIVKQSHDAGDQPTVVQLMVRRSAAAGATSWAFWRRDGDEITHDGLGVAFCADCHQKAPRDFFWSVVE